MPGRPSRRLDRLTRQLAIARLHRDDCDLRGDRQQANPTLRVEIIDRLQTDRSQRRPSLMSPSQIRFIVLASRPTRSRRPCASDQLSAARRLSALAPDRPVGVEVGHLRRDRVGPGEEVVAVPVPDRLDLSCLD